MSDYIPDRWAIIKITEGDSTNYKILGSWFGGWTDGDSWRLSSGITSIEEGDDRYWITNHSGSIYNCFKGNQGTHALAGSVLSGWQKKAEESGEVSLEQVDIKEVRL